jgi:predicted Zn-dependent protease
LVDLSPESLRIAEAAVRARPADPALLLMAALAGLLASQPDRSISYLKRFERKFETDEPLAKL